jgi:hypothetical protein
VPLQLDPVSGSAYGAGLRRWATDITISGVAWVHTPAMTVDFDFSWSQFLWMVFIFVGVPTMIGAGIIWSVARSERDGLQRSQGRAGVGRTQTGVGRLGLWATGLVAFPLGFLSCAGWLSWSADYQGEFAGPDCPHRHSSPPGK